MAAKKIYQFKITLRDIRPPIWRRFQVPTDINFYELHQIIQTVMGWYDAHLHQFDLGGFVITDAETLAEGWDDGANEKRAKLSAYLTHEGQKIRYEYDFGDDWQHDLLLEKILPAEPDVHYPRCLKGKRACPPEDCGGAWGYSDMLESLADPEHEEYEMYAEWIGEDFDPKEFDLDGINAGLERFRK